MATITTMFRPNPTCYEPLNLWLDTFNTVWPCGTEIPPPPVCTFIELGRPGNGNYNDLCHQDNRISTGVTIFTNTAYSACPEGMTGAKTETNEFAAITTVKTICCPTAYDFAAAALSEHWPPCPIPSNGITYSCVLPKTYTVCKATSIKELSDQTVTLTVSKAGWQPTTTSEVEWDYENGFIVATPAMISKRLYTDPAAGTTSTCFGDWGNCAASDPSIRPPTSTPGPGDRYISPRLSPAINHSMPAAPCCPSDTNLWPVSGTCPAAPGNNTDPFSPLRP